MLLREAYCAIVRAYNHVIVSGKQVEAVSGTVSILAEAGRRYRTDAITQRGR